MRKSGLIIATLATAVIVGCGLGTNVFAADAKAQITDLEHKCAAATSVDELMKCYEPSDDLIVYDIGTPREFDGQQAVRGDFQNFFDNVKNAKIEIVSMHVVTDGKLALANSVQHFSGVDKSGKPTEGTFRVTDVWQKQNGVWKIIHTHASYPVDLATGKADMQSK